jgi:hypothetical protein
LQVLSVDYDLLLKEKSKTHKKNLEAQ